MAAARTIAIEDFTDQVNYELRNSGNQQFKDPEMLVYYNKSYEMLYQILSEMNSEMVATGSGSITLAANTETYDLSTNSMGDLWLPFKVDDDRDDEIYDIYVTDSSSNVYERLPMVDYKDRHGYVVSGSTSYTRPEGFYLDVDNIGFLPVPDTAYTVTIPKYIPNFVPASADSENMPFKNLFNQEINESMKMIAKNRNNDSFALEPAMMDILQERAIAILRRRRKKRFQLRPRMS